MYAAESAYYDPMFDKDNNYIASARIDYGTFGPDDFDYYAGPPRQRNGREKLNYAGGQFDDSFANRGISYGVEVDAARNPAERITVEAARNKRGKEA
jgi:hypothetical protein